MATRVDAMRTPTGSLPRPPHIKLLVRLSLVFLIALVAAAGFALVYRANVSILPPVLAIATAAGLGLVSGFSVRWMLASHTGLLRGVAAPVAIIVGLSLLGLLTW